MTSASKPAHFGRCFIVIAQRKSCSRGLRILLLVLVHFARAPPVAKQISAGLEPLLAAVLLPQTVFKVVQAWSSGTSIWMCGSGVIELSPGPPVTIPVMSGKVLSRSVADHVPDLTVNVNDPTRRIVRIRCYIIQ